MLHALSLVPLYVLPILVVLTLLVTFHELGHFLAAKTFRVAIDQFSIGFGKAIWKRTDKSGVEWRVGWIPLGGYVRFSGDENVASVPDAEDLKELREKIEEKLGKEAVGRFYHFKPIWQRAVIAAAGPFANFLLAFVLFAVLLSVVQIPRVRPIIGEVTPNSPAAAAGFLPGDLILRADGRRVVDFGKFARLVSSRANEPMEIKVKRGSELVDLVATPKRVVRKDEITGLALKVGQIGLSSAPNANYIYRAKPAEIPGEALQMIVEQLDATFTYLGRIFKGRENGDQLSGVIGMAGASGSVAKEVIKQSPSAGQMVSNGFIMFIQISASISIGLGFVNLLPIPVLDGGHLLFYAYEAIARRPLAAKFQAAGYRVGLALVVGLMLFGAWNDLQRYQAFQFLGGLFS